MVDSTLYSLRSPLDRPTVVSKIHSLGQTSEQLSEHRLATSLEVLIDPDPLAPVLDVFVEDRRVGTYITVRLKRNPFLQQFLHAVRCLLGVALFLAAAHTWLGVGAASRPQVLAGLAAGWAGVMGLLALAVQVLERTRPCSRHAASLRYELGRLTARGESVDARADLG